MMVVFRLLYQGLGRQKGSHVLVALVQSKGCEVTEVTDESLNAGWDSGSNVSWPY